MIGRSISPGKAEGTVVRSEEDFSFLGGVNASTGELKTVNGGNLAGKVFVFPKGKGSTVGSFVMYDLMVHGKAPAAVINRSAETIVTTGAVISSIPMVDGIDVSILRDGDSVSVDGDTGAVDITNVGCIRVVSSAILVDGRILLLTRPHTARSFPDAKSLVAGKIEAGETPEDAAGREIMEETGIGVGNPDATHSVVYVREGDTVWEVHPFLYRLDRAEPVLNSENTAFEWIMPEDIGSEKATVPRTFEVVSAMLRM